MSYNRQGGARGSFVYTLHPLRTFRSVLSSFICCKGNVDRVGSSRIRNVCFCKPRKSHRNKYNLEIKVMKDRWVFLQITRHCFAYNGFSSSEWSVESCTPLIIAGFFSRWTRCLCQAQGKLIHDNC